MATLIPSLGAARFDSRGARVRRFLCRKASGDGLFQHRQLYGLTSLAGG
jgi:hypothetical protein